MLDWTQAQLAERAGLSTTGIINIERGTSQPKAATISAIQRALEAAGIEFTNCGEPGVRLKRSSPRQDAEP